MSQFSHEAACHLTVNHFSRPLLVCSSHLAELDRSVGPDSVVCARNQCVGCAEVQSYLEITLADLETE